MKLTSVFYVIVWPTTGTGHTVEWGNWTDHGQSNQSGTVLRLWQFNIQSRNIWRFEFTISVALNDLPWRGRQQAAWWGTLHHLHWWLTSFPATDYKARGRHVLLPGGQWSRNYTQDFQIGCLGFVSENIRIFALWEIDFLHTWNDHYVRIKKKLTMQLRFQCPLSAFVCWI